MQRRRFLLSLAASIGTSLLLESRALAGDFGAGDFSSTRFGDPKELSFLHTHTGERLTVAFSERGSYLPDALASVNHFLRDFRNDEVHPIDPELLDALYDLRRATGSKGEYQVISGYRSAETNEGLRRNSRGVAKHSLHLDGKAIDVRLDGVDLSRLRDAALAMERGGVGYYKKSDFVHIDTGRVRSW